MSPTGTVERKPSPSGPPADKGPHTRTIVGFLTAFGMGIAIFAAAMTIVALRRQAEEDRIAQLQRALLGVDALVQERFRFPDKAEYVRADLLQATTQMKAGHPDRQAFVALAGAVADAARLGSSGGQAEMDAIRGALAQLGKAPVHDQIRKRALAFHEWLTEETAFLQGIEAAEAALGREEFDAAAAGYTRVPAESPWAPRAAQLRDDIAAGRAAVLERGRRQAEDRAALERQTWEQFLQRVEKAVASGRVDETREEMDRVEKDVPAWAVERFRALREGLAAEQVREQAEKAYRAGRGTAVLAALQDRTEPELIALRERVGKVVVRYEALVRAEEEGRPSEVERLATEIGVLEPSPGVWYREQTLRLIDAQPAARAARWLERAVERQGQGDLSTARRLMEAAREVHPGPAADHAINTLVASIQKEINLLAAAMRAGKVDRGEGLRRLDAWMAGLRPSDKFWDKAEGVRKELSR